MTKEITFKDFSLDKNILDAIEKKGFTKPSEIQQKVIPVFLENKHDIVGIAQTGTGKTGAFGLPLIHHIEAGNKTPQAIILAPTRELALQVSAELSSYCGEKRLNILTVYGGAAISDQIKTLSRGVDIVVGTPGRVLDLIKRRKLDLSSVFHFILDEADEMLKMGFIEDIETILSETSPKKRVLLFSATMPQRIKDLSKKYMQKQIIVEVEKKLETNKLITQVYYEVRFGNRFEAIKSIMEMETFFYGIVFCRTRAEVDELTSLLKGDGYAADCIHGDITQAKREKILKRFKDQKLHILVATDVAARGIDVDSLTHVINYNLPNETETYVHRIGRTGRAGNAGTAITFITAKEQRIIKVLERITGSSIKKGTLPERHEVASRQNEKLIEQLNEIIKEDNNSKYIKQANELLDKHDAKKIVSALLYKMNYKAPVKEEEGRSSERPSRDRGDRNSRFGGGNRNRSSSSGGRFSSGNRDRGDRNSEGSRDRPSRDRSRFNSRRQ